jgi:hypothetical protein
MDVVQCSARKISTYTYGYCGESCYKNYSVSLSFTGLLIRFCCVIYKTCLYFYESLKKEVLYNIHIEFDIPLNVVTLIKMCLNENYSEVYTGKDFSIAFHIHNYLM